MHRTALYSLLCLVVSGTFSLLANADTTAKPYLIGAMGDSITAGTFADGSAVSEEEIQNLPMFLPNSSVPFIGEMENKDTYSWASGKEINSHFLLLNKWLKGTGVEAWMFNVSVPGARSRNLDSQAAKIVAEMKTGKYRALKYVTLLIGANDACAKEFARGTPEKDMEASINSALKRLSKIEQTEPIRILVPGIPKIPDLGKPEFMNLGTVAGFSCHWVRDEMGNACPHMIEWQSEAEYRDKLKVIDAKNDVLKKVVADSVKNFPTLNLAYTDRFYKQPIQAIYLARDCFHPNAKGQNRLSLETWADQPWFK